MAGRHRLDPVLLHETRDSGMMGSLTAGFVQRVPTDLVLLPARHLTTLNGRQGDSLRPSPARVDPAVIADRHSDDESTHSARVWRAAVAA